MPLRYNWIEAYWYPPGHPSANRFCPIRYGDLFWSTGSEAVADWQRQHNIHWRRDWERLDEQGRPIACFIYASIAGTHWSGRAPWEPREYDWQVLRLSSNTVSGQEVLTITRQGRFYSYPKRAILADIRQNLGCLPSSPSIFESELHKIVLEWM